MRLSIVSLVGVKLGQSVLSHQDTTAVWWQHLTHSLIIVSTFFFKYPLITCLAAQKIIIMDAENVLMLNNDQTEMMVFGPKSPRDGVSQLLHA